jgi:hypothetical protein
LSEDLAASRQGRLRLVAAGEGGAKAKQPLPVTFSRSELSTILGVYGRKVASGEWRDYALDMLREKARFSIFQRASDVPMFVVEKEPKLRNRQGMYRVTTGQGRVLRRGHELASVLRVIDHDLVVIK